MQIIRKPWDRVSKLWARPHSDGDYRLIRYIIREKVEDGELFHHTLTGALVLLNPDEIAELDKLPCPVSDVLKPLVDEHFIVPVGFDENKVLNELRFTLRLTEPKGAITGYTILPTTYCNARCFYCYESNIEHRHMTPETADEAVSFIRTHHGSKDVALNWFGGEPLVGWKMISRICEGLKSNGIPFRSHMISNGYLFDREMVDRAKNIWNLKNVQITLDGTHDVYNSVKSYASVSDDPYARVLDNIDNLLNSDIWVSIRLNMDKHNHENLSQLIDELAERFHGRKGFAVYCAVLFDNAGFEPIPRCADDDALLLGWKRDIDRKIREKAVGGNSHKLPQIGYNYCMADGDHTVIINPDGTLSKCEHRVDENLGNLKDGLTDAAGVKAYKAPLKNAKCLQCALQPSCYHLENCETDPGCSDYFMENAMNGSKAAMEEAYQAYLSQAQLPDDANSESDADMEPSKC